MSNPTEHNHGGELAYELGHLSHRFHLDSDDGLAQRLQDRALQLLSIMSDFDQITATQVVRMLERCLELTPRGHPSTATRRLHLALTLQEIHVSSGSLDALLCASRHTCQASLEAHDVQMIDLLLEELHLYIDCWQQVMSDYLGKPRHAIAAELVGTQKAAQDLRHFKQTLCKERSRATHVRLKKPSFSKPIFAM